MAHDHHHDHGNLSEKGLLTSVVINVFITISQIVGGLVSGSLSLLSDALHNFSDVISLIISYVANRLVKKEADVSKTFGYKRAEIIATFVNASALVLIALYLLKEAVVRFFESPPPIESNIVISMAAVSIVGNGICVVLLHNNSKDNMNIKSSYLHLLTDMFTSFAVLIGGLLMTYYQIYWVDSVLTALIGLYLIYMGFGLLKSSFKVLMLFSPDHIPIDKLVDKVNDIKNVKNIHHVHIWLLNEDEVHLEAHIDFHENIKLSEFDRILKNVEKIVQKDFGINHINIQPEFRKCDNKSVIVQD